MENYLRKHDAAFYHITFPNNWKSINEEEKLKSDKFGQIFVIRSCDENILFSLAIGQLGRIYTEKEMVILKLSQTRNNFSPTEIGIDTQSSEPTMPIQNIIYKTEIPLTNIEYIKTIKCEHDIFTSRGQEFDNHKENYQEFIDSFEIIYHHINNTPMKLVKVNDVINLNRYTLIKILE